MTTIYRTSGVYPEIISNTDSILDSRTIIETLEELKGDALTAYSEEDDNFDGGFDDIPESWLEENDFYNDIRVLLDLCAEGESIPDWEYGVTMVHDSYFVEFAQEFAQDVVPGMSEDMGWPFYYIDWERAAADLQQDYTTIDFDGETYWVR